MKSSSFNSFKYSVRSGVLTEEQHQFYEDNGYILLKNKVRHALLDEMRERFQDICNDKVDRGFMVIVKDPSLKNKGVRGEYSVNKVQDFLYDEVLLKYCFDKAVTDVVECIIGPNITAFHSMIINKPPDADPEASLHPLHQDMHYFPFRPAERIVASWTAMSERVDENNGCLYVIPGSHKGSLLEHKYPKGLKNMLYHGIHGLEHLPRVNLIMEKGDTVFFHPLLLHGSGPNRTKGFRKAISCHYADTNCHFVDVRGTTQEQIAEEVENLAAKLGLVGANFADVWKFKSKLVKGPPGNFQKMNSHF